MCSWLPSLKVPFIKPLTPVMIVGSALLVSAPALARNRSNGNHRGGFNQPQRTQPNVPASPTNQDKPANKKIVQGCNDKGVLTIATYNVENFWDDLDANSGTANYAEYEKNGSNWYTDKMYTVKAQHVADAIRMAGSPDIVAMQEFESANNTGRSLEILKPYVEALGYKYFALGQQNPNNPVAVTTAVISKYPIVKNDRLDFKMKSNSQQDQGGESLNSSARDPQVVSIDVNGQPLRLYTAHWKSKRGDQQSGDAMRTAIAELIKSDIESQVSANPQLDVLVMGDFNSDYNERPLQEGLKSTDDKDNLKRDLSSDKMYNLWFELQANERCSYVHQGDLQCLDHILTNANLFDGKGIDLVENSFEVVGHNGGEAAQKLVRNDGRTPNRWGMQKNNGKAFFTGTGYSDHLPLVGTFKLPALCTATSK